MPRRPRQSRRPAVDEATLRQLLEDLRGGKTTVDTAVTRLRDLPMRDIGIATVDHHRTLRQGMGEVIYGAGKSADDIVAIVTELASKGTPALITRIDAAKAKVLREAFLEAEYDPIGQIAVVGTPMGTKVKGPVAVVTAGTSDAPVALEAAGTLRFLGYEVVLMQDVGVAGIHRLLARLDELHACRAAIVIAGMEGALPSVVGGLFRGPMIAVPTSVGYGVALGGITALFGMLTSCAAGVTVVNIDNGFGAAAAIHRILGTEEAR